MYREELLRKGFPIGAWLLKIFLIVVCVILIIYIFLTFFRYSTITNYSECKNGRCNGDLRSQIFAQDLIKIKNDIIPLYTEENLPKEEGDSKLTIFADLGNNNVLGNCGYNLDESYVEITKIRSDFLLKISVQKKGVENYILLNIGHYPYCKDYLCENIIMEGELYEK